MYKAFADKKKRHYLPDCRECPEEEKSKLFRTWKEKKVPKKQDEKAGKVGCDMEKGKKDVQSVIKIHKR